MLPNFIIGGAMRSGTTSLHYLLSTHRDVFFPPRQKEYYFFSHDPTYAQGLSWLERLYTTWNGQQAAGQTSPNYLYIPATPARIHTHLPDAKLIFILRNPVERAYSHYWHSVGLGGERLPFETALACEHERLADDRLPHDELSRRARFSYVSRGFYTQQLNHFREYFDDDQMLILFYDDLKLALRLIAYRCAEFLKINPTGYEIDLENAKPKNAIERLHVRIFPHLTMQVKLQVLPYFIRRAIHKLGRKQPVRFTYPPMKESTRHRLQETFRDDILALQQLTGRDLRHWLCNGPEA